MINDKLVFGSDKIKTKIFAMDFYVGRDAFFQVNSKGLESIYSEVIEIVKNKDINTILDLYCGTGTISLLVSPYVKKVYGVEIVKEAIVDANYNKKINNISNTEFFCMDAKDFLEKYNKEIDMIIVDPPRSGIDDAFLETILQNPPKKLIYISCNPSTLGKNLKILKQYYQVRTVIPFDLFPNTPHVESLTVLTK